MSMFTITSVERKCNKNYIEITRQPQLSFYCLQNSLHITTCFDPPGHLHVIHNLYKILGRISATQRSIKINEISLNNVSFTISRRQLILFRTQLIVAVVNGHQRAQWWSLG